MDRITTLTGMDFKLRSIKKSDTKQDLCLMFEKVTKSDEESKYFHVWMNREDMYSILCDLVNLEANKKTPMLQIPMYDNGIDFSDEEEEQGSREKGLMTVCEAAVEFSEAEAQTDKNADRETRRLEKARRLGEAFLKGGMNR